MITTKWLTFQQLPHKPGAKTERWRVFSKDGPQLGGCVWHSPWRRYVFWPLEGTIYEQDCLRDIAQFCEDQTREHKAARR